MRVSPRTLSMLAVLLGSMSSLHAQPPARPTVQPVKVEIEAQPLAAALNAWASQTGYMVLVPIEGGARGIEAPRVAGTFTPEQALTLLLARSGLRYEFVNPRTVSIRAQATGPASGASSARHGAEHLKLTRLEDDAYMQMAEAVTDGRVRQAGEESGGGRKAEEETEEDVVIVTGTSIKGAGPIGQNSEVFTREDMVREGIGNLRDLGESITQNFGGGNANPAINNLFQNGAATIASTSGTYISSFNLRGLGVNSTLTLLNGRRVAPSGGSGAFAVTAIPINLIDRVEIVPDGGSAVYGSDAVGGVINVVTRTDFSGIEATARHGAASGHTQTGASALAGTSWESGNAFIHLDFTEEDKLVTGERDFISFDFLTRDTTLIPDSDRKSVYASLTQAVSPRLQAGVDLLWAEDNSRFDLEPNLLDGFPGGISLRGRLFHGSLRGDYALSDAWSLNARVDYSSNDNLAHSDHEFVALPMQNFDNRSTTVELGVAGSAIRLPAGEVQMAFGGLLRRQEYEQGATFSGQATQAERDVNGAYGEIVAPVARGLKLNLAARWDDYSSGGSQLTPKYGISWQATESLGLRASYSEAYRVPVIPQQLDRQILNFMNANWTGRLPGDQDPRIPEGLSYYANFFRSGNPDLVPEAADIFTAGFDFKPEALPGFRAAVTYFDIQYTDMIISIPSLSRLNDPDFAQFVQPYPDLAFMQERVANAETVNNFLSFPIDLDSVQVTMRTGLDNVAAMQTSGLDVNTRYGMNLGAGRLNLSVKASYVFKYVLRATTSAAPSNNVNRVGDPLRLTLRGSAAYSYDAWTLSAGVGFKDSYVDDYFSPFAPVAVDSSTIFNLGLRYDAAAAGSAPAWARGWSLSLHADNLTDEKPPYVQDFLGLNYDVAHGDAIGRFVSFEISRRWGR